MISTLIWGEILQRRFAIIGHLAPSSGKLNLNDLAGSSGRMDVLVRVVNAALFVSHGIRRDTHVTLLLCGGPGVLLRRLRHGRAHHADHQVEHHQRRQHDEHDPDCRGTKHLEVKAILKQHVVGTYISRRTGQNPPSSRTWAGPRRCRSGTCGTRTYSRTSHRSSLPSWRSGRA